MRFLPHGLYLGLEMVVVTDGMLLQVIGPMIVVNIVKRARLTRKTRPGVQVSHVLDPGHPTPRRWNRLRSPSSEGEGR